MTDSYKIIISISHHRISFEYHLKGGDEVLVPMPPGSWPAPLAFYCSPTGIVIGEDAARASQAGTANAFTNYFDLLPKTDVTYEIGGERKPIGKLLLDASETIFRDFYASILLNKYGSLNDNRLNMPLTIVCESDIKPNENFYIKSTFKDSGYAKVRVVNYDRYIHRYIKETISKQYTCDKVLVVWAEGSDLSLTLFDARGDDETKSKVYPNLGVDPRLNYVMHKIWDSVGGESNWLDYDREEPMLRKAALDFFNSSAPLVNDEILFSNGIKYRYSLLRSNIDYIQNNESMALKNAVDEFLRENSIENKDKGKVQLLLRGAAAGNPYFENTLNGGFHSMVRSDNDLRRKTMELIVSTHIHEPEPAPDVVLPGPRDEREFRELRVTVKTMKFNGMLDAAKEAISVFVSQMHAKGIHAFDERVVELLGTIPVNDKPGQSTPETVAAPVEPPPESAPEPVEPGKHEIRGLRIAKAEAKSANDYGDTRKAVQILKAFRDSMAAKHITAFNAEIDELISKYSASGSQAPPKKVAPMPKQQQAPSASVQPTGKDKREFIALQKSVETKLSHGDIKGAKDDVKEFAMTMRSKGITAFDDEINKINDKIKSYK